MRLVDIVARLDSFDRELCIVAEQPWSRETEAALVHLTEEGRVPVEVKAEGYEYFLEVDVALEDVCLKEPSLCRLSSNLTQCCTMQPTMPLRPGLTICAPLTIPVRRGPPVVEPNCSLKRTAAMGTRAIMCP